MLSDAVTVDGIADEEEVAGIVHGQRPEGIGWQGHSQGYGVVVACGGVQSPVLGVDGGGDVKCLAVQLIF